MQGGEQVLPLAGRCGEQRLVAVERQGLAALAAGLAGVAGEGADQLAGPAQGGRDRFGAAAALGGRPFTADDGERQLAVGFGDQQLQAVAGLGREGQGEGDGPLVDQRAVGAVGQQSLNLRHDPVAGNQSREAVGDVLGGGDGA